MTAKTTACPGRERCHECGQPEIAESADEYGHEFQPDCTAACDAEFWRAFGCSRAEAVDGQVECTEPHHTTPMAGTFSLPGIRNGVYLAPIKSNPASPESWMAMKEVLLEFEERGIEVTIDRWATNPGYGVWAGNNGERGGDGWGEAAGECDSLDTLPAAVATAMGEAVKHDN